MSEFFVTGRLAFQPASMPAYGPLETRKRRPSRCAGLAAMLS